MSWRKPDDPASRSQTRMQEVDASYRERRLKIRSRLDQEVRRLPIETIVSGWGLKG
jgi:hypothetical protein